MYVLKKTINGSETETVFDVDEKHTEWVKEVLKCLEGKTVYAPVSHGGDTISILEHLPLVVSNIRFVNYLGYYYGGLQPSSLFINDNDLKINPQLFAGRILLSNRVRGKKNTFCYALAHELLHAINKMHFVYPAFKGLKKYKSLIPILTELNCDDATDMNVFSKDATGFFMLEKMFGNAVHGWYDNLSRDAIIAAICTGAC